MLPYSASGVAPQPSRQDVLPKKPFYKRPAVVFGTILGVIVAAGLAFAAYYFFFRTPAPKVEVKISLPERVLVGEPFIFSVAYQNISDQELKNAVITLNVPEGISIIGVDPSLRVGQQSIGDIGPQGIGSKTFQVIATDGANSIKRVSVALRYGIGNDQRTLVGRELVTDIPIGDQAIRLNLSVPQNVFGGQNFEIGLKYSNNSQNDFQDVRLIAEYPETFQFENASSAPTAADNEWLLGALRPNDQGEIIIKGRVNGAAQSFFTLGTHMQVRIQDQVYEIGAHSATVGISTPPLALTITANGKPGYVSSLGDNITYTLNYKNGSRFSLQNVVIQVSLEGEMFSIPTLRSKATLDSVRNILIWNTANTPALNNLPAGASGSVEFNVTLLKSWPIQQSSDKDFALKVRGNIRSLSVPAGITANQTISDSELLTKVAGQASIVTTAYFKEPGGQVVNQGPYPPRANQATQYTIHWLIRNFSTDLKNIRVAALLESGATMVKVISSSVAAKPVYNSNTGQVTWDIDSIPATGGLLSAPIEAVFQISATPAVNRIGQELPLLGQTTLTALDTFTSTTIRQSSLAKTSSLTDDTQAASGDRRILP